jgi:hypothetical protein
LHVEFDRTASGALSVAFRGAGSDTFWRLGELLLTDLRAIPLERPLEGLDQLYWRLRLADGAVVMLCEDTMAGVSIDAEGASAEASLRALAQDLCERQLGTRPIHEVRRALEPALAAFPVDCPSREEIQAAAGLSILAGLLIGALANSFLRDIALVSLAAVSFAGWRQLNHTRRPNLRAFVRDLQIAGVLTIFSLMALALRTLIQLWWSSAG